MTAHYLCAILAQHRASVQPVNNCLDRKIMNRILVLSDIHGNWPALRAIARENDLAACDVIINCGDSTVYAPFANQVLDWLRERQALSILGNTDSKVCKLLQGKIFKKPSKAEKRIMYTHTAATLTQQNQELLLGMKKKSTLSLAGHRIIFCHGSPEKHTEFLFSSTPEKRFHDLAHAANADIIITGHTHEPLQKRVDGVYFLNPGSVGRMFDGTPTASYLLLEIRKKNIQVSFHRCAYAVEEVVAGLREAALPEVYVEMFRQGRKLN
jgi:putative phosphoesterase